MSARNEYLDTDEHSKASDASRKAWDTARSEATAKVHARTLTILGCRRKVILDNSISRDARLLFVWLLDLSLWKDINTSDGAIAISGGELCEQLGCCFEALTHWKRELLWPRYIWISDVRKRGQWNSHLFHIQAIDPQEQWLAQKTVDGILKADGPDRPAPPPPKKRRAEDARRPLYLVDETGKMEVLANQAAASAEQSDPLGQTERSAPSNWHGPLGQTERTAPSNWHGPLGQTERTAPSNWHGPLGQTGTGGSAEQSDPLRQTGILRETPVNLELGRDLEAVNRVIAQEGAEKGNGGQGHNWHDETSENDFLALCREVMGRSEVDDTPGGKKGNGGLWRLNFRRDDCRDLCWQVMRNARVKKREGFIPETTWAQFCTNDWIRMAGAKARA